MTIATFIWVESPGTSLREEPKLEETQFGDGYLQVAPKGLNSIVQMYTGVFRDVDNAIADDMVAFLRANAGLVFAYTPLWATVELKFISRSWTRTQGERWGVSDLSVDFQQIFQP